MIVTNHFVYIHMSRHAGTFINKLIIEHVPGARMLRYHGHLSDLPIQYHGLPVIGFVRNPWDWYVSMYYDYRRKQQYIFQIISNNGMLNFEETISKFLLMGQKNPDVLKLKKSLIHLAPDSIVKPTPANRQMPGITKTNFADYVQDQGYYSWLYDLMYKTDRQKQIHIGRFEDLRHEMRRLLKLTGVEINSSIDDYLNNYPVVNQSMRNTGYRDYYSENLRDLVSEKDNVIIQKYGYEF